MRTHKKIVLQSNINIVRHGIKNSPLKYQKSNQLEALQQPHTALSLVNHRHRCDTENRILQSWLLFRFPPGWWVVRRPSVDLSPKAYIWCGLDNHICRFCSPLLLLLVWSTQVNAFASAAPVSVPRRTFTLNIRAMRCELLYADVCHISFSILCH